MRLVLDVLWRFVSFGLEVGKKIHGAVSGVKIFLLCSTNNTKKTSINEVLNRCLILQIYLAKKKSKKI